MGFIKFNGITKRFPGVLALDNLDFQVLWRQRHRLRGEPDKPEPGGQEA